MRVGLISVIFMLLAGAAAAQDAAVKADTAPVVVQKIFSGDKTAAGQPIVLPQGDVQVVFSTYTIAPAAKLPVHRHPFPRYAYVLDGEITVVNADTQAETTYKKGDVILELIGLWHFGENRGSTPTQLLVIDQAAAGEATTVLKPH